MSEKDFKVKKGLVVVEGVTAASLDISGDVDVDGTLEADAITLGGTAVAVSGGAFHDGFSDFVANEHIDHSGVSISAGNGLTGGGTIASTRTLAVGAGTGVTVNANDVAIGQAVGTSDDVTFSTVTLASDLIHSGDTNNKIAFGTDTQSFQTGGTARFNISDSGLQIGSGARVTEIEDNDNLGTSDTKLATQGNIKAYVDANAGGGASALNDLTDVISNTTNFTDSILISPDGAAPPQGGTLSSATDNIGIGKDVFSAGMTSGHSNVAIGTEAGKSVTNSHEAVYIGHHAGKSITYGEDNVCIGAYTIDNGAGASANVAVGWSALTALTGGGSNTAVGYNAGSTASSSTNNVFIGREAGKSLNASYNVIIGSMAGDGIASGGNNTLIGYIAGGNMSGAADSNICIGYQAGDNITTGDNNLVIGNFDVDVATGDDQIIIGSGDGGVTWIKGDSNGIKALKIKVKAVSGNTTLTDAQSGSYVYWTAGTLTLPAPAESGQQYTIINNTGGSATPALGTSNAIASGWTAHAAMSDETARTYVAVAANTWIYIG